MALRPFSASSRTPGISNSDDEIAAWLGRNRLGAGGVEWFTTAQDRIMIYGPKADGYLVEFRTAEGEALSIPGTEATVSLRRGQVNAVRAAFKAGIKPSRIARWFGNRNQM
jgi:hypothetical protein